MYASCNSAVVKSDHFNTGASCYCSRFVFLRERTFKADYLHRASAGYREHRTDGMCAVERRIHSVSPVIGVTVRDGRPDSSAVMNVFAFYVLNFADLTFFISELHFKRVSHIAVVLSISIYHARLFHGFDQFYRLSHSLAGKNFGHNVKPGFHAPDSVSSMLVCVICKNHSVHIMFNELFKISIKRYVDPFFFRFFSDPLEKRFIFVANRNKFRVIVLEQYVDHRMSACSAEHADF